MIERLLIGAGLTVASIVIVSVFGTAASVLLKRIDAKWRRSHHFVGHVTVLSAVSLWMLMGLSTAIWMWALAFRAIGQFSSLEEAAYFAAVSFTTLGFGDVLLDERWRFLAGVVAANGLILFSFTTAFLIQIFSRISRHD